MHNSVLRAVDAQTKLDIVAAIEHELERRGSRTVEHDALKLALTVIAAEGDHRAERSLQLLRRIARKLSSPRVLGTVLGLNDISDRPLPL